MSMMGAAAVVVLLVSAAASVAAAASAAHMVSAAALVAHMVLAAEPVAHMVLAVRKPDQLVQLAAALAGRTLGRAQKKGRCKLVRGVSLKPRSIESVSSAAVLHRFECADRTSRFKSFPPNLI
jgi:uncharacterized protein with PhoU and TrkA domain